MLKAERLLDDCFPGLEINLRNPLGVSCPSVKCRRAGRDVLSIGELYRGFTSSSYQLQSTLKSSNPSTGDPNKYTTRCPHCYLQFVPRFTVKCSLKGWKGSASHHDNDNENINKNENVNGNVNENNNGNNNDAGNILWCELLSPWTLRKEMFNVLFQDGVSSLLADQFHKSSAQHAVVFWNAIVSFRLRGLPYAFMLSNDVIAKAFPPRDPPVPVPGPVPGPQNPGPKNLDSRNPVLKKQNQGGFST